MQSPSRGPSLSPICSRLCVEITEDIVCRTWSQIPQTESGLLGQHLAHTALTAIRLARVLAAFFSSALFSDLFVSVPMCEPHSFSLCPVIWASFNPTTLGNGPAVRCQALPLCATAFDIASMLEMLRYHVVLHDTDFIEPSSLSG